MDLIGGELADVGAGDGEADLVVPKKPTRRTPRAGPFLGAMNRTTVQSRSEVVIALDIWIISL